MMQQFNRLHGSLWDRGSADSHYSRPAKPHWYPEGTYNGEIRLASNYAEEQEYLAGYAYNEQYGDKKSWD